MMRQKTMQKWYDILVAREYSSEFTWRQIREIALRFINHFKEKYGEGNYRIRSIESEIKGFGMNNIERIRFVIHAEVLGVTEKDKTQHGRYLYSLKRYWDSVS